VNSIITYFRESWEELRRVNWPTRDEVIQGTQTVLIFVIGSTLILYVGDIIFRALARLVR
jgi:preprotein translocase subunit SecE